MVASTARKIVRIDEERCDGCGLCVPSCAEGAIRVIDGKARLVAEIYCDGLGACLGTCPRDAIAIEERVAEDFDPAAVERHLAGGSCLSTWPVQLALVPPTAPFLAGADLLICADCVPFAVPDFHRRYLKGRAVLVGCPKLDNPGAYQEKLREIIGAARPASVVVLRMEVPCCGGIARAAIDAVSQAEHPNIPLEVQTVGIHGGVRRDVLIPRA